MTSANHLILLEQVLTGLLHYVLQNARRNMWFQRDGVTPDYGLCVRVYLTVSFDQQWIDVEESSLDCFLSGEGG